MSRDADCYDNGLMESFFHLRDQTHPRLHGPFLHRGLLQSNAAPFGGLTCPLNRNEAECPSDSSASWEDRYLSEALFGSVRENEVSSRSTKSHDVCPKKIH